MGHAFRGQGGGVGRYQRCEALHWWCDDRLPSSRLKTCIPSRLDQLKTLYLEGLEGNVSSRAVFPEFPLLEELHLKNHMTSSPLFKESDLKKLWVLNTGFWTRGDLVAIYHFRFIRWLTLESVGDIQGMSYSQVQPVILEYLKTLELIGMVPKKHFVHHTLSTY